MSDVKETIPSQKEVVMHTQNPIHECEFKWIIDNVSKFSRRLRSSFTLNSQCKPEFQLVAKFHERYPNITHVNVGIQRIDDGQKSIYADVDISLKNINGDVYKKEVLNISSIADESPHYCLSELFASSTSKLKFRTSFSSDSDSTCLTDLEKKGLIGSFGNSNRILVLPGDVLIIKGVMKTHGCCVVTDKLETPDLELQIPQQTHIDKLLEDFRSTYEDSLFTDVELKVDQEVIRAHRFVLSSRSPVFRRMFEHNMREKKDGNIDILDVEKPVLEALVWYLYTGIVMDKVPYETMCGLYAAADKYEVFSLQQECARILTSLIDESTVCTVLGLADLHNDDGLKREAMDYMTKNFHNLKAMSEWEVLVHHNTSLAAEVLQEVSAISVKSGSGKDAKPSYLSFDRSDSGPILNRHAV